MESNIKPSQVVFVLVGILTIIFGILYVIWPVAPYHEEMMGTTFEQLKANSPSVADVLSLEVDALGLAWIAMGVFILYLGPKAWDEIKSRFVLLIVVLISVLPLTYVVYTGGGPFLTILFLLSLSILGILLSHLESD